MVLDTIIVKGPALIPSVFLLLGMMYLNYSLIKKSAAIHWNFFMTAAGLLGISITLRLLLLAYPFDGIALIAQGATALSALLFAFTAYALKTRLLYPATASGKKWQ